MQVMSAADATMLFYLNSFQKPTLSQEKSRAKTEKLIVYLSPLHYIIDVVAMAALSTQHAATQENRESTVKHGQIKTILLTTNILKTQFLHTFLLSV